MVDTLCPTPLRSKFSSSSSSCSCFFFFFLLFFFFFFFFFGSLSFFLHNAILNGHPQWLTHWCNFVQVACCRAIGLQWRSAILIQHLDFHEKKLVVGGAYDCFLTLVALLLEGHVSLHAQTWPWVSYLLRERCSKCSVKASAK